MSATNPVIADERAGSVRRHPDDQASSRHTHDQGRQRRLSGRDGAKLADVLVRMEDMVDLVQRERALRQQEDGAGQGDHPGRSNPILSQRPCTHRSE